MWSNASLFSTYLSYSVISPSCQSLKPYREAHGLNPTGSFFHLSQMHFSSLCRHYDDYRPIPYIMQRLHRVCLRLLPWFIPLCIPENPLPVTHAQENIHLVFALPLPMGVDLSAISKCNFNVCIRYHIPNERSDLLTIFDNSTVYCACGWEVFYFMNCLSSFTASR